MREAMTQRIDWVVAHWRLSVVAGITVGAVAGSMWGLVASRNAAIAEAGWLRQRLTDKRALVRALHEDLTTVEDATARVAQMASIAHGQNLQVRRLAQLEEPREPQFTPARLAALDGVTLDRSEEAGRALAQLAFLEEQLAATTDSLALMTALAASPSAPPARSARARIVKAAARRGPEIGDRIVPTGWPVYGDVSSRFGYRESPYGRGVRRHTGIDIRAAYGEPVGASAAGVVVFAGRDSGGYGTTVVIDHGDGVKTLYGHLSGVYVRRGQRIGRGAAIAAVGNSGRATGVHLHYEVRIDDVPVDPMRFVRNGGPHVTLAAARAR